MTFGIVPTAPETGYGYIEAYEPFRRGNRRLFLSSVLWRSPTRPRRTFFTTERFTWNSGMFLFQPAPCWRSWSSWPLRW